MRRKKVHAVPCFFPKCLLAVWQRQLGELPMNVGHKLAARTSCYNKKGYVIATMPIQACLKLARAIFKIGSANFKLLGVKFAGINFTPADEVRTYISPCST